MADNADGEKIGNISIEAEKNLINEDKENDSKEIVVPGETLSNTRIQITFSEMNESNMSHETFKTYKSTAFHYDNLDLDIPNFSPPKYKTTNWKLMHSCNCLLFAIFFGIATGFIYTIDSNTYYTLSLISHLFLFLSTFVEWTYFKRGCIGESNLNSKLKSNIDQSWKAKVLRGEYGITYFLSFMASVIFLLGDIIHYFPEQLNLTNYDAKINFVYFNIFGMMTLGLSQIFKLDKILNLENKISYVKTDFSKLLFEALFFFASLLDGGDCIIQLFNLNIKKSPLFILHLIIKVVASILFVLSNFILQFNYFFSEYCNFSQRKYRKN